VKLTIGTILNQGNKALIKEAYGVSGRGSIIIESQRILEPIIKHLEKAEHRGAIITFIVEPLLNKQVDFSCHFNINQQGDVNIFSVQQMHNKNFAFNKIRSADDALLALLDKKGYFKIVKNIAKSMYASGYYGSVCLDSMLTDQGIFPLVEINARISMGLINYQLQTQLATSNQRSHLYCYNLRIPHTFSYKQLINRLKRSDLLFTLQKPTGIVLLNANALSVNPTSNNHTVAARMYFALFSSDKKDTTDQENALLILLKQLNAKVY
jgi:hypothetical protein